MEHKRSLYYSAALFALVIFTVSLVNYERMSQDWAFVLSTIFLAISLAFVPFSFRFLGRGNTEESRISGYGLVGAGAMFIAATGIAGFTLAYNEHRGGAIVACALVLLLVLGFFFVTGYSAEEIDKISVHKALRSDHARWAVKLEEIAAGAESQAVRLAIQKRAASCRYQPRDIPGYVSVGPDVDQCIEKIADMANLRRDEELNGFLESLDRLLERRANSLKMGRSKI